MCNIGTGRETSVNRLFAELASQAGVDTPAEYAPLRAGELLRSSLDPGRAGIHLGWKPWTGLAEGTAAVLGHVGRTLGDGGSCPAGVMPVVKAVAAVGGDVVDVTAPGGTRTYEIVSVRYV